MSYPNQIQELICLREGLLPSNESQFTAHQIYYFINNAGDSTPRLPPPAAAAAVFTTPTATTTTTPLDEEPPPLKDLTHIQSGATIPGRFYSENS
jgi:hypothetical protein